jgi:hypothetical protein
MKKMIFSFLMMCLPAFIFAQLPGQIKGKVFESDSKKVLPGAMVYVEVMGKKIGVTSDADGQFTIKPLNPGTYTVYFSYVGFNNDTLRSVTVAPDQITFLDNTYLSSGINMITLVIHYQEKLINPEKPSVITVTHKEITEMPDNKNIISIISHTLSDVYASDDDKEIYFRGSRNGDAAYYVDGVKTMDNNLHIPGNDIGSMTVYSGGVPANYGDFTGGVVVIETQSYFSWLNERNAKN